MSRGATLLSRPAAGGYARWVIGGLLCAAMFVCFVDRANLAIAAQPIAHTFHLSASTLGVLSSAFLWSYAAFQIPIGPVLDKIGVTWVNRVAVVLWSLATFLTAAAGGLGLLLVSRLLLGVAETPTFAAGWKATGYWFPRDERGMCTSLFDGGAKVANVLGMPIMAYLVSAYGWPAAFVFSGALSLLFAVAFWVIYRDPRAALPRGQLGRGEYEFIRAGGAQDEDAAAPSSLAGLGYLVRRRKTWGVALGFAASAYAFYVLLTWMPSYLQTQLGLSLLQGGLYTTIPWLVGVITEVTVGGWLIDRCIRRGGDPTRVRRVALVLGMLGSLAVTGAGMTRSLPVALAFLSVGTAGLGVASPTGASIVALIAPEGMVGTLGGIVNFTAMVLSILAPMLTGVIVDATGSFAGAFLLTGSSSWAGSCRTRSSSAGSRPSPRSHRRRSRRESPCRPDRGASRARADRAPCRPVSSRRSRAAR